MAAGGTIVDRIELEVNVQPKRGIVTITLIVLAAVGAAAPIMQRNAAITLKVEDFALARAAVERAASEHRGALNDASVGVTDKGRKHGWVRIIVPAGEIQAILPKLRAVGVLFGESVQARDRTSEHEELGRRLSTLAKHSQRLGGILQSGRRLRGSDILFVQERLFRANADQELLSQRRSDMVRDSQSSSIVVTLFEPPPTKEPPPPPPGTIGERFTRAIGAAWLTLGKVVGRLSTALAFILVFAVLWVPAAWVVRAIWKRLTNDTGPS